jgi:histidinol-phosphate aminotransferase
MTDKLGSSEYASTEENVEHNFSLTINPLALPNGLVDSLNPFSERKIRSYQFKEEVEEKIQESLGTDKNVFMTNGCDGALDLIAQAYFDRTTEVAIPVPSFPRYQTHVEKTGATAEFIENPSGYHPSIDKMADSGADFILLANPVNPTGEKFSAEEISELKRRFDGTIILDEAMRVKESQADLVDENLILVGSFSKLYGLAGLRAGYLVTQKSEVEEIISPFQANSLAIEGVKEILDEKQFLEETRTLVEEELEFLKKNLPKLGVKYSESRSFTLLMGFSAVELSGEKVHDELLDKGIKTVKGSNFRGLSSEYLRISIGKREANARLIESLSEIVDSKEKTLKNTGGKNDYA